MSLEKSRNLQFHLPEVLVSSNEAYFIEQWSLLPDRYYTSSILVAIKCVIFINSSQQRRRQQRSLHVANVESIGNELPVANL